MDQLSSLIGGETTYGESYDGETSAYHSLSITFHSERLLQICFICSCVDAFLSITFLFFLTRFRRVICLPFSITLSI